ncbi:MAG: ribonuclease H-like domain-containing protein [Saprospiraceae bacterium]
MRHLFLDCEWTLDQNIFLISYAFKNGSSGSIYGQNLNKSYIRNFLIGVKFIYVYGPDIAYLEKNFPIDFRERYYCINMLKLVKIMITGLDSYKLEHIEKLLGINRTTRKYKTSVFTIWKDWHDIRKRQHVIRYNLEDSRNLREVFYYLERNCGLNRKHILQCRLI